MATSQLHMTAYRSDTMKSLYGTWKERNTDLKILAGYGGCKSGRAEMKGNRNMSKSILAKRMDTACQDYSCCFVRIRLSEDMYMLDTSGSSAVHTKIRSDYKQSRSMKLKLYS